MVLLCAFARESRVINLATAYTARADSANYKSIVVVNEYPPSFGGGEGKAETERR